LVRSGVRTVIAQATDPNPITSGNPGIGFFRGNKANDPKNFCFSSLTASSVPR
jgi:hypothetical protein